MISKRRIFHSSEALTYALVLMMGMTVLYFKTVHYLRDRQAYLHRGDHIPYLTDTQWKLHRKTVVLFIQIGCPYCDSSMPFYRSLATQHSGSHNSWDIAAVFPNDESTVKRYMDDFDLDIAHRSREC